MCMPFGKQFFGSGFMKSLMENIWDVLLLGPVYTRISAFNLVGSKTSHNFCDFCVPLHESWASSYYHMHETSQDQQCKRDNSAVPDTFHLVIITVASLWQVTHKVLTLIRQARAGLWLERLVLLKNQSWRIRKTWYDIYRTPELSCYRSRTLCGPCTYLSFMVH